MFLIAKPSDSVIRDFLARQRRSGFSYPSVGVSALTSAPAGYVTDHSRIRLGYGERIWRQAVEAIHSWQMFNMGWLQVCWPGVPIAEGTEVAILVRHFGFWSLNAARIVCVVSEESGPIKKYGFSYGTLPDHAESGEERFLVEWHAQDDSVWYDLFAFSRPRVVAARLGYPVARWLQYRFRKDSKEAMSKAVSDWFLLLQCLLSDDLPTRCNDNPISKLLPWLIANC